MKKRIYSKESKGQAVQSSYQRDNIKVQVDESGIDAQRIYKWRRAAKDATDPHVQQAEQEDAEVKRLRKALKDKGLELDGCKKAIHVFSNDPIAGTMGSLSIYSWS